jgi:hypothetical protein
MQVEKKGKANTKGSKQIVEENANTLKFYRNMSLGVSIAHFLISFLLGGYSVWMIIIAAIIHLVSNQFLIRMSRPLIDNGNIIDSGVDLNLEGGFAEHIKDVVILTSGTQILSIISNWFWFLLLLGPIRAFHLLWGSVIKPYFFGGSENQQDNDPVNDKKQKKMERKMKRMNNIR